MEKMLAGISYGKRGLCYRMNILIATLVVLTGAIIVGTGAVLYSSPYFHFNEFGTIQKRSYFINDGTCPFDFATQFVNNTKYSNSTKVTKCTNEGVWIVHVVQSADYWKPQDLGWNGTVASYVRSPYVANLYFFHSAHKDALVSSTGLFGFELGKLYKVIYLVNEFPHECKYDYIELNNGTMLGRYNHKNLDDIDSYPTKYGLIDNYYPIHNSNCDGYGQYAVQAVDTINSTITGKTDLIN